jgi:Mg2+-importing ATPase
VARRLALRRPETEFERGIRHFGYLLTSAMLVLVLVVFAAHVMRGRPPVETLLFSVALAVGLSPELLPAILSVNLARGATSMAGHGVLVRRLDAIENLGSMDVLCTDKTGTLTEGVVQLEGSYDAHGRPSPSVLAEAATNAALETGIASVLDSAILASASIDAGALRKRAEVPFDFSRKRSSIVIEDSGTWRLITKGTFSRVLDVCTTLQGGDDLDEQARLRLQVLHDQWTGRGIRVLAVASRTVETRTAFTRDDERDMMFVGFLTFLDRPKNGAREAIDDLKHLGVSVKMLSGDSRLVASHVAGMVGLRNERLLTGADVDAMSSAALWHAADAVDVFAEVEPAQKERIIFALKRAGHVVGFLGDGINDAPAMHAADTSLSVEHAVDVARETADFVLLRRNLDVIRKGIEEGRRTFANTLKYVLTTTSANLGNMVSMAVASLALPFLPLLAGQILLNNFLSDIPAVGIADDTVDQELVSRPERWNMRFIGRVMFEFGILSSLFDAVTFVLLLATFHASAELFRTAWFVESLLSELVIALVVRTRRVFFLSRPGNLLMWLTAGTAAAAFVVPFAPGADLLGFVPLPPSLIAAICGIVLSYLLATELLKRWFFRPGLAD